jgi:hypothetical protein
VQLQGLLQKSVNVRIVLIIITALLCMQFVLVYLLLLCTNYKFKLTPDKYPYIDFSRNFISSEHYLTTIQPLRDEINNLSKDYGYENVSIYVEFLNTGSNIIVNQDNYIWPASLVKVPVGIVAMKNVENGLWQLSDEFEILSEDISNFSGGEDSFLATSEPGTRISLEVLLEQLLAHSDNTAYNVLLRNISQDDIKRLILALGLDGLLSTEGKLSAKNYSRLFRVLYSASYLSRENSTKILEWLDSSEFNDFLAKPIPKGVMFPHKFGQNDFLRVYLDSGIVYLPDRPYIISVAIQGDVSQGEYEELLRASDFMHKISQASYSFFSTATNADLQNINEYQD